MHYFLDLERGDLQIFAFSASGSMVGAKRARSFQCLRVSGVYKTLFSFKVKEMGVRRLVECFLSDGFCDGREVIMCTQE